MEPILKLEFSLDGSEVLLVHWWFPRAMLVLLCVKMGSSFKREVVMPDSDTDVRCATVRSLDRFLSEVRRFVPKGKIHIFRGENSDYGDTKVCSALYRELIEQGLSDPDVLYIQHDMSSALAEHSVRDSRKEPLADALARARHHGQDVNVIDFTSDCLVAAFFACDGKPDEDGQVYGLDILSPHHAVLPAVEPAERMAAQKSVLVMPFRGYVEPNWCITIPSKCKDYFLRDLRLYHGIVPRDLYEGHYGFAQRAEMMASWEKVVRFGVAAEADGRYDDALGHYRDAVRKNTHEARGHKLLAHLLESDHKTKEKQADAVGESVERSLKVIRRNHFDFDSHMLVANRLHDELRDGGWLDEAKLKLVRACYEQAFVMMDPWGDDEDFEEVLGHLVALALRAGDYYRAAQLRYLYRDNS